MSFVDPGSYILKVKGEHLLRAIIRPVKLNS